MSQTILVIDLVGYSQRLEALEEQLPGSSVQLNLQIEEMVRAAVQSARLHLRDVLFKFTGDGAILKVDHPDLAHRIAVSLQHASQRYNRDKKSELARRNFRVGIATGQLTQYDSASGSMEHGGTTIGRAQRLEAGCVVGGVTIDSATHQSLPPDLKSLYKGPGEIIDKNNVSYPAFRWHPSGDLPPQLTGADIKITSSTKPISSTPLVEELEDFRLAMRNLFGSAAPLGQWCLIQGWQSEMPPSICAAIANGDPVARITSLFVQDVLGALERDLESKKLILSDNKEKICARMTDCMGAALALSMEPLQRRRFVQAKELLNVPAKTKVGADLATRPDPLHGMLSDAKGLRHRHSIEPKIENGEGRNRRWEILAQFVSMASEINKEGRIHTIESKEDADYWGGRLRAAGLMGNQRILVIAGTPGAGEALSNDDISWLLSVGIKTVILGGEGQAQFWLSDEDLVVGIVHSCVSLIGSWLK